MLELIILLSILMVALSVGMLLLKFVFAMVLLPFKILFFLTKGLLALVFVVPLMLILRYSWRYFRSRQSSCSCR